MASCFRLPYRDRFGAHEAVKWAETAAEAIALHRKGRTAPGLGPADYGEATLVIPQPFTPEAAAARVARLTPPFLQLIAT